MACGRTALPLVLAGCGPGSWRPRRRALPGLPTISDVARQQRLLIDGPVKAQRQWTSAALCRCALWRRRHLFWIYSRPRARRSVECTRGTGGTVDCAPRDLRLCPSGCACSTDTAEHATSMGRATGRRFLHQSRWARGATAQQQRKVPRHRPARHLRWNACKGACVSGNRPYSRATGTHTHPRQFWPGLAGRSGNRCGHARTVL